MRKSLALFLAAAPLSACVEQADKLQDKDNVAWIEMGEFVREADGSLIAKTTIHNTSGEKLCVMGDPDENRRPELTNYATGKILEFPTPFRVTLEDDELYVPREHPLFIVDRDQERSILSVIAALEGGYYLSDGVAGRPYKKGDMLVAQQSLFVFNCSQDGGQLRQTGPNILVTSAKSRPLRP